MSIGYYVHHHGAGHLARAEAIARELQNTVTLIGTGLGTAPGRIDLADDRVDMSFAGVDDAARPSWLHYAPLHHRGVQQRNARITAWIEAARPRLLVADVSVEIACLARLCGVPVVSVRLPGNRNDEPHTGAFRDAVALLAPFPEKLESPATPYWVVEKTFYAGYVTAPIIGCQDREPEIVVILGRGGMEINAAGIAAAAASTPSRKWRIVGDIATIPNPPPNANFMGWVDSPAAFLSRDTILIGSGGDGTVGAAAAAGCHLICIPQTRPYGEQLETAAALQRAGAAIICHKWPEASEWPALLEKAADADPAPLTALYDPMAARRTANFLKDLAVGEARPALAQNGVPSG